MFGDVTTPVYGLGGGGGICGGGGGGKLGLPGSCPATPGLGRVAVAVAPGEGFAPGTGVPYTLTPRAWACCGVYIGPGFCGGVVSP